MWTLRLRPQILLALALAPVAAAGAVEKKVPDVVVAPAAVEAAPAVDAPIAEVTVFSDRARVRRRGRVALKAGAALVRLPDLPGAVFLDTIRVAAGSGRVLRVEATPVERERLAIDQAVKLLDELDAVSDHLAELDDRIAADDWEVALLARRTPAAPVPEEKRQGRKGLAVDVTSWAQALDFLGARAAAARARLGHLADERRSLVERRDRLQADLTVLHQGGFSQRLVQVLAVVEATGSVELELEYFVPGARWRPAYDLHFSSARGQVRLETAAVVEQATGEDWTDAALAFSTAIPGRGIDLPELLTWTLGERGDFVPRSRASRPPPVEPAPQIAAAPPAGRSAGRALDEQVVRERLARAVGGGGELRKEANYQAENDRAAAPAPPPRRKILVSREGRLSGGSSSPPGAPAMAPAPEAEEAYEAPPPAAMAKSPLSDAPAISRRVSVASSVSVPLALFEAPPARRAPVLTDPYLPAVSACGFDYVHQAPAPATVPSTGKQIRIPLAAQSFRIAAFYEATPALAPTAFLRARVRNDGKRPLLRGPANIFGDGELVGQGELATTGPAGEIEMPLGADQDIRLVRQVVPTTRTTGLVLKSEETVYDVQIQVGNYKKQPISVEVIDQVPRSRNDKVEVKLLGTDPQPQSAVDADGTLRFRVDVAAGGTRVIKLRYQITRPKDWVLYQR